MAEYHVGCGAFAIYAGTLNPKNKNMWANKTECTDEAIDAVRDYMVDHCLGGFDCSKAESAGYEWDLVDGRKVELTVTIKSKSSCDTRTALSNLDAAIRRKLAAKKSDKYISGKKLSGYEEAMLSVLSMIHSEKEKMK